MRHSNQVDDADHCTTAPTKRRPRILLITDRAPGHESGHAMRVDNTITALASMGDLHVTLIDVSHDHGAHPASPGVQVIPSGRPQRIVRVLRYAHLLPSDVHYRRRGALRRTLASTVGAHQWDLIWCCRARIEVLTSGVVAGRRIVDLDDLNDELLRSTMRHRRALRGFVRTLPRNAWDWIDALRWSRLQRRISERVDRVVVCSDDDEAQLGVANGAVVPNGYPEPLMSAATGTPALAAPTIVFAGAVTYEPNRLAVEWFIDEVLPVVRERVPDVRFVVIGSVGRAALAQSEPGVEFVGRVEDVAPYFAQASVAIAPIDSGGGTRLKVLEALARGVPLVTTSFGCAGFGLVDGTEVMIADSAPAFASACIALLEDPALADRLVKAGRDRYEQDFSAAACRESIVELARSTLKLVE